MCWRTASSLAMFIALVTTVTAGAPVPSCRSGRVARARATSLVVVPPLSATPAPPAARAGGWQRTCAARLDQGAGGAADALLLRCVPGRLVPQRQVVGDVPGDHAAAGPG